MSYSTLFLTDASHIDGNTASVVSSPASLSPRQGSSLDRQRGIDAKSLKKETSRCSSSEESLLSPACPLAERRRHLRVLFHADGFV